MTRLAHSPLPCRRNDNPPIYGPELQSGWDGRDTQSIPRNGDDAMMMQPQNAHGQSKEQAVDHKSKVGYLVKYTTLNWTECMGGLQYSQSLRHASESEMFSFYHQNWKSAVDAASKLLQQTENTMMKLSQVEFFVPFIY